jgi:cytochrome b561
MAIKIPKPPFPGTRRKPKPPGTQEQDGRVPLKEQALEAQTQVVGWLDERTGTSSFLRGFLFRKVPKGTNWFYTLGSATMFAFLAQAVTGIFLAMYYDPSATRAYDSIQHINNDVWLGAFVRGMHHWGASVMIVLIFLHMGRTFFFGAYKYPRELNWVVGVVLLVLTLAMGLTGYLLPFDQRSFWATVVAVNINGSAPFLGPYLRRDHDLTVLRPPHAADPGADRGLDRGPHLPRHEARHDRASVAQGQAAGADRARAGLRFVRAPSA